MLTIKLGAVLLIFLGFSCISFAQNDTTSDSLTSSIDSVSFGSDTDSVSFTSDKNKLKFNLEIPIWIPGFRGRFSVGDITIEGEGQNDNLLSDFFNSNVKLDYYFVGSIGIAKNKWQLQSDIFGGQLNDAIEFTYNKIQLVDAEIFTVIPRLFVSHQLWENDFKRKKAMHMKHVEFWVYGGCRYFHLKINSKPNALLPPFDISKNWFDPIVGFTVPLHICRFTFIFQNDFGGFGLGSDFTYWFQLYGKYRAGKIVSIAVGWVHLNISYSDEKDIDSFHFKAIFSGPMAGVMFTF